VSGQWEWDLAVLRRHLFSIRWKSWSIKPAPNVEAVGKFCDIAEWLRIGAAAHHGG